MLFIAYKLPRNSGLPLSSIQCVANRFTCAPSCLCGQFKSPLHRSPIAWTHAHSIGQPQELVHCHYSSYFSFEVYTLSDCASEARVNAPITLVRVCACLRACRAYLPFSAEGALLLLREGSCIGVFVSSSRQQSSRCMPLSVPRIASRLRLCVFCFWRSVLLLVNLVLVLSYALPPTPSISSISCSLLPTPNPRVLQPFRYGGPLTPPKYTVQPPTPPACAHSFDDVAAFYEHEGALRRAIGRLERS
eukprot:1000181-Pleurochrysis_carterae.AAC.1